jgi:hypothetical protein
METLIAPKIENIQSENDIEVQVDGMSVAYRQNAGARRTEYTGDISTAIDGGEPGTENNLGSFEMGDISLPVVAKFTVENKPQSYVEDAAPESEFLVVDIRGFGLLDSLGTSVSGLKASVDAAQRFGGANQSEDAPQFALVNLTSIQRHSREGGSMFSISTISRDPESPTVIRRDHTLHGEAAVDSLSTLGIGESNVMVTSDENGKLIVSMTQESDDPIRVDTTDELLNQYEPRYVQPERDRMKAERLHREKKVLGESAIHGLITSETFNHYKSAYDQLNGDTDFWTRATTSDFNRLFDDETYDAHDTVSDIKTTGVTGDGPLQTAEDVQNRIAYMRQANMSDKEIKKTLLREVHPDFKPDVNPDLAKVVTNEFRPKPQEYRNETTEPASETAAPSEPAASTSNREATTTPTTSAEVVPVSSSTQASQTQPSSSDFTQAA